MKVRPTLLECIVEKPAFVYPLRSYENFFIALEIIG